MSMESREETNSAANLQSEKLTVMQLCDWNKTNSAELCNGNKTNSAELSIGKKNKQCCKLVMGQKLTVWQTCNGTKTNNVANCRAMKTLTVMQICPFNPFNGGNSRSVGAKKYCTYIVSLSLHLVLQAVHCTYTGDIENK